MHRIQRKFGKVLQQEELLQHLSLFPQAASQTDARAESQMARPFCRDAKERKMEDKTITMPVIALRGMTVLPKMMIHFDISRSKSIAAVEKAMIGDQKVCLVTQKKSRSGNR